MGSTGSKDYKNARLTGSAQHRTAIHPPQTAGEHNTPGDDAYSRPVSHYTPDHMTKNQPDAAQTLLRRQRVKTADALFIFQATPLSGQYRRPPHPLQM